MMAEPRRMPRDLNMSDNEKIALIVRGSPYLKKTLLTFEPWIWTWHTVQA
jgi:hypothetical protein